MADWEYIVGRPSKRPRIHEQHVSTTGSYTSSPRHDLDSHIQEGSYSHEYESTSQLPRPPTTAVFNPTNDVTIPTKSAFNSTTYQYATTETYVAQSGLRWSIDDPENAVQATQWWADNESIHEEDQLKPCYHDGLLDEAIKDQVCFGMVRSIELFHQ